MAEGFLERASFVGTIVAALAAVATIYATSLQFVELQTRDRQARAVDLFVKYNELQRDAANEATANVATANVATANVGATSKPPVLQASQAPADVKPSPADRKPSPAEVREQWRRNLSIAITESIWILQSDDAGWRNTVSWMLVQEDDRRRLNLGCSTYDPGFVAFAIESLKHQVCDQK